jgi:3-deoxy-D-manno-octulosonic-acid transferase
MRILYAFAVRFYGISIRLVSPFNEKAAKWVAGRRNWKSKIPTFETNETVFWFHCASLGEFDMALPIMDLLKNKMPDSKLLVTFFSPSGMDHYHKRPNKVDEVFYLPEDTRENARKFISSVKPSAVFLVKYEFWSNFIFELNHQNIPIVSVCSVFRKEQRFFRWYGGFFRKTLRKINHFYVQDDESKHELGTIGINSILVVGDTRYDKVLEKSRNIVPNSTIESFLKGEKAWVFGSTWEEDESILIPLILENPNQKIILAPHTIGEQKINLLLKKLNGKAVKYSEYNAQQKQVLILNTIGHLSDAYSYAELAYIGGGFSGKLHNILEPSVFGVPVIFGPKFTKFPEAQSFIDLGIGCSVGSYMDLKQSVASLKQNFSAIHQHALENVQSNSGAAQRICDHFLTSHFTE